MTAKRRPTKGKGLLEKIQEAGGADSETEKALEAEADALSGDDLPPPTEMEAHVEEVVRLMAAGTWRTGPSHVELAEQWGRSIKTVRHVAAEASRTLRRLARYDRDDDGIRATLIARAAMLGQEALERRRIKTRVVRRGDLVHQERTEFTDPDHAAALRAVELEARLLGLLKQDVALSGPDGGAIPIEAAAVVVLPPQNNDGEPPALETTGVDVTAKKPNGKGKNGAAKRGNSKGSNGKGGNGAG